MPRLCEMCSAQSFGVYGTSLHVDSFFLKWYPACTTFELLCGCIMGANHDMFDHLLASGLVTRKRAMKAVTLLVELKFDSLIDGVPAVHTARCNRYSVLLRMFGDRGVCRLDPTMMRTLLSKFALFDAPIDQVMRMQCPEAPWDYHTLVMLLMRRTGNERAITRLLEFAPERSGDQLFDEFCASLRSAENVRTFLSHRGNAAALQRLVIDYLHSEKRLSALSDKLAERFFDSTFRLAHEIQKYGLVDRSRACMRDILCEMCEVFTRAFKDAVEALPVRTFGPELWSFLSAMLQVRGFLTDATWTEIFCGATMLEHKDQLASWLKPGADMLRIASCKHHQHKELFRLLCMHPEMLCGVSALDKAKVLVPLGLHSLCGKPVEVPDAQKVEVLRICLEYFYLDDCYFTIYLLETTSKEQLQRLIANWYGHQCNN